MTAAAYGVLGQLGISATSPVTDRFDFQSDNLVVMQALQYLGGLRGTRDRDISRVRYDKRVVAGSIGFQPNAIEWSKLLPWFLGADAVSTTYSLAETIPTRAVSCDRIGKVFTYDHVLADTATMHAVEGKVLSLNLGLCGGDETVGTAGSFPALAIDSATAPFVFYDLVISAGAISPPTLKAITKTAGGTLADNTYYYVLTAITGSGSTTQSNEVTVTTATQKAVLTWTAVNGATGYKVYRSLVSGTYSGSHLLKTVGAVVTYTDDGSDSLVSGAPSATNASGAATYNSKSFSMSINNMVDKQRFLNSQTLSTGTGATDRLITAQLSLPYSDTVALYNTGLAGTVLTAVFTNGGAVLTFTMNNFTFDRRTPPNPGRQEIMLPINGFAYANGAIPALITTLSTGP